MIFIGDIACPKEKISSFLECVNTLPIFDDEIVVANLEANILESNEPEKPLTLYNTNSITQSFVNSEKLIVSLANNHMYDYPEYILRTKAKLENAGIGTFGICETKSKAEIVPYCYLSNGIKYAFFGHCWRLYTHTNTNRINDVGVIDDDYDRFIDIVEDYIKNNPETRAYCFMHWNYDLEKLVMPMHRNIARKLIDVGAAGVIGSHSHVPQGAELYKGRPIVYGLGNFYLPSGFYFDGKLTYPASSKKTYALKITGNTISIIWFNTDCNNDIVAVDRIETIDGQTIKGLSPFTNMTDTEYVSYFRKNRTKKLLVPVFVRYSGFTHKLQEFVSIHRVKIIRAIKKLCGK